MKKNNWFEVKVKVVTPAEEEKIKKSTEIYYVDALSFTEVETRIYKEMEVMGKHEFEVEAIKKSNISQIITSDDVEDSKWYKCKIILPKIDDEKGSKASNEYALVMGKDTDSALLNSKTFCNKELQYYEIGAISDTKILDLFTYNN